MSMRSSALLLVLLSGSPAAADYVITRDHGGHVEKYKERYAQLRDIVTETEPTFRDDLLADIDVVDLLIGDIVRLSDHWRSAEP